MQGLTSLLAWAVPALVGVLVLLFLFTRWLVNVGAKEIAIKERRYLGKKMPPGRVVATAGEVGIQADVLKPGLHFVKWPFERVVQKVDLIEIGPDQIGIIEAIDGEPMPSGRIFAPDKAQNKHNNFQDPIAFLTNGGVKGIQMRTLPPGKWPIHPYLFRVSIAKQTEVPQGKVGVVTSADGMSLDAGRLLGKAIEGHNHFQDAEAFIAKDGQKGPQVDILTPGTYRIHSASAPYNGKQDGGAKPGLFTVTFYDAAVIPENKVGMVDAQDGKLLDSRDYVAAPVEGHDNFQNGDAFITKGGQRGPQKDFLRPGRYYINPLLFKVILDDAKEVKPGEVAVVVSNFGKDPTDEIRRQMAEEVRLRLEALKAEHSGESAEEAGEGEGESKGDPADKRLDSGNREAYVVPDGYRGIQKTVVGPGKYYVNTLAQTAVVIPTTNQTVEWTEGDNKASFDPFEVISKDGFKMKVEIRVVFRVKPEDAPHMVSKIGSIDNLKQNVMHPTIDSIFRNQASESSAMAYLQNRHDEQVKAEQKVRGHLLKYHVDVVNVLICNIHLPEELMTTQTEKILADQRQTMYAAQQAAQQKRIELEKITAQADQQKNLMAATIGVEIAERQADQRKRQAAGEAAYILETGKAQADVTKLQGEATAAAYEAQVKALGEDNVANVKVIEVIGEKGVKITPDVLVSGGGSGDGAGGLATVLVGNLVRDSLKAKGGQTEAAKGTPAKDGQPEPKK